MGEAISYKGKLLGHVRLNDNGTNKFVFTAEDVDSLTTLFQIRPDEQVETEGRGFITYDKFKNDYLSMISAFYPSLNAWLLKNYKAKTIEEFERTQK